MTGKFARLSGDRLRAALALIPSWQRTPTTSVACPECATDGLRIADHSVRPHAEWYTLSCTACGLDESIHSPMSLPRSFD